MREHDDPAAVTKAVKRPEHRAEDSPSHWRLSPQQILSMQRLAGNTAVATALPRRGPVVSVQRDGPETAPAPAACAPTGLSRPDFLQQAGTAVTEFGLTTITPSQATFPEVVLDERRRLRTTTAALPPISSVYVGAGVFTDPHDTIEVLGQQGSGCPTGHYPRRWNITPPGASRIAAGEQEHCDDFHYAFDISLRRYADAVNALAGRRYANEAAAKRALRQRVGVAPDDWQGVFYCLVAKSPDRDRRRNDWHTPRTRHLDPWPGCRYVTVVVDGNSLPHVGVHPPSSVIRGCGETPTVGGRGPGRP